jgi:putative metallohydrolase (TIGR04338 family)
MRDGQRSCVYGAENILQAFYDRTDVTSPAVEIGGSTFQLPPEARFASIESIQAYCDMATDLMELGPVKVRARQGASCAHYEPWARTIAIPADRNRWAMRELVVLHELAHHMTNGAGDPGHGPKFVTNYIDLLSRVMGPEVGMVLRMINADGGVKEGV